MGTKLTCTTKIKEAEKILKDKGLDEGGTVQQKFTLLLAKYMNNYIPYDKGFLKDVSVVIGETYVDYKCDYAKKQYYTNKGNSPRNRGGRRGAKWDKKAWGDKSALIIKELNEFIKKGGKG